jgi:DNA-binding HxlR family transcriptional regulator
MKFHRRIRYNDLMNELQSISPKTLADTLKELKNNNLVERISFNEIPLDYTLTKEGRFAVGNFKEGFSHCTLFMFTDRKR